MKNSVGLEGGGGVDEELHIDLCLHLSLFQVVEAADVVLQVLDARDPLGSRCRQVEEAVLNSGTDKKLVLILNKIDLVPKENIMAWLKHLRNELPTLAFRCSTQSQNVNLVTILNSRF